LLDTDHTGAISVTRLRQLLLSVGQILTKQQVDTIFRELGLEDTPQQQPPLRSDSFNEGSTSPRSVRRSPIIATGQASSGDSELDDFSFLSVVSTPRRAAITQDGRSQSSTMDNTNDKEPKEPKRVIDFSAFKQLLTLPIFEL